MRANRPAVAPIAYLASSARRLYVFVPALMGVGVAFWLGALTRDYLRRHGDAKLERRARVAGPVVAAIARSGHHPSTTAGLRPRRVYLLWGLPLLALATYIAVVAARNYSTPGGAVAEIGWLLAAAFAVAIGVALAGSALLAVGVLGPRQTVQTRRLVATTVVGTVPADDADSHDTVGPSTWITAGLVAATIAVVGLAVAVDSTSLLQQSDERVSEALARADWLEWVEALDPLGSSLLTIVAAALLGLASFRCRPLLLVYPMVVIGGLLANKLGRALVPRERPAAGLAIGDMDSFPSGHVVQLTLILGLLPLTLQVLTRRTLHFRLLTAVAVAVVALSGAHRIRSGAHWPTDVVVGVLIGGALVLFAHWVLGHTAWHSRCHHCPWGAADTEPPELRGAVPVTLGTAQLFRLFSHLAAFAATVFLAVLAYTRGIPVDGDAVIIDEEAQRWTQLALAGLVSVGAFVSWKWDAAGAVLLALAATGLGIFAAAQYEPSTALAVTVIVLLPAVLLWLSWQHHRTAFEIVAMAAVTLTLVGASWIGIREVHDTILGPTHPSSRAHLAPTDEVEWVWSGGLAADEVTVVARLRSDDATAQLHVSGDGEAASIVGGTRVDDDLVRFEVDGLEPDTHYTYAVDVDGELDEGRGTGVFHTPASGATSFRFVAGSCSRTGTNGAVFDAIADEDPLFFLQLGDLHYDNINRADRGLFDRAIDRFLGAPGPAELLRQVPISYVWDDHDYGPNDADASSPTREVAREFFRDAVPSHELAVDDGPIHRAFTVGRVRFVVTDTRSERTGETMLGDEQLRWLLDELVTAAETHALVVWANPTPWISDASRDSDLWGGRAAERAVIADTIATAEIDNLLMVSGDAHMLAFDDGTNTGYQRGGGPGFPLVHAAALDRPGSVKGGPYTSETFPGGGQYAVLDVVDDGGSIVVHVQGKTWDGDVLIDETVEFPIDPSL